MIRVMYDSDQPDVFPPHAGMIATYSDLIRDYDTYAGKYPGAVVLLIDRGLGDPTSRASIIDVEGGARTPADVPGWLDEQHKRGEKWPTVYASRSTMPQVEQHAGATGWYRWFATLDGTAYIDGYAPGTGPVAVQILPADKTGLHADMSIVYSDGWNPIPALQWSHDRMTQLQQQAHQLAALASSMDTAAHRAQIDLVSVFPQGL